MNFSKYLTIKKAFKLIFHTNFDVLMHRHSLKSLIKIDLELNFHYKHTVVRNINFAPMYLVNPKLSKEIIVSTTPYGILIMQSNAAGLYGLTLTFC